MCILLMFMGAMLGVVLSDNIIVSLCILGINES